MGKKLLFSTLGNQNFGDESMAINYIDKNLNNEEFEIISSFYVNAKKKYNEFIIYDAFEKLRYNKNNEWKKFYFNAIFNDRKLIESIKLKDNIEAYDEFIMCGGGNLNSMYLNTVIHIYLLVKLFKINGKKVIFRPQSIGPFNGKKGIITQYFLKKIISMSDEFYAREKNTYTQLKKYKTKGRKILLVDDAWTLEKKKIEDINLNNILNKNKKKLGISLRPWNDSQLYKKEILKLIDEAIKLDMDIFFIPIAYGGTKEYIDNGFIKDELSNMENIYFLEDLINIENISCKEIKWIVSEMDYCIGLSYHFNVYSNSLRKKSIGLYNDEYYLIKNGGLYELLELNNNIININDINKESLRIRLDKLEICSKY